MGKRENKVETYLKKEVEAVGGISRKWVSPGVTGVTDQIIIVEGHVWFVEVKTLDGHLSTAQRREQLRLSMARANVRTVYGREGVDEFIEEVKKKL